MKFNEIQIYHYQYLFILNRYLKIKLMDLYDQFKVQDSVNKYRYGVLLGNSTEERFGIDLIQKQVNFFY